VREGEGTLCGEGKVNGCWKCGRYERIKIEKIYSLFNN